MDVEQYIFGDVNKTAVPEQPAPVQPEPATTDNDWLKGYAAAEQADAQQVKDAQILKGVDPDKTAEIYKLSKETGYPVSVVRHAFDDVKDVKIQADNIPRSTIVKDYIHGDFDAAAISKDDIEPLENTVQTWDKVKRSYKVGDINSNINVLITQRQLYGGDPAVIDQQIKDLEQQLLSLPEQQGARGIFQNIVTETAEQLPQMLSTQIKGVERGLLGASVGAAGSVAIAQPELAPKLATSGFGMGYRFGIKEGIFNQEFGGAWKEFSEIRDEDGKPLDPALVNVMAIGSASVNVAFEFFSFKKAIKAIGGEKLLNIMTKGAVKDAILSKPVQDNIKRIVKDVGGAIATEEMTEVMQEIVPIIIGELVKKFMEATGTREFQGLTQDEIVARVTEVAGKTIYSVIGFVAPGSMARTANVVFTAEDSQNFHNDNNQINEAINETKTKQRSPDHANRFLKMLDMGKPIFLSADGINLLYQENSPKDADAILHKIGVNPTEAKQIAATGQDVEIVQSDAHANLDKKEFAKISKDLKPAPSAYTQRELDNQVAEDDVAQAVKIQQEQAQEDKKVKQQIDRLASEIKAAKIGAEAVETTPILLNNLAERISYNSEQSKAQVLEQLSFKRMPFEGFKDIVAKGKALLQSAFHGTPHRFDKFSLEHLGKGEGAQAFGWGLYFAEKKDIANWYRRNLSLGKAFEDITFNPDGTPNRIGQVASQINAGIEKSKILGALEILEKDITEEERLEIYKNGKAKYHEIIKKNKGAVLKVDLPDDDQILNWELPLSEQSEVVKAALSEADIKDQVSLVGDTLIEVNGEPFINTNNGWQHKYEGGVLEYNSGEAAVLDLIEAGNDLDDVVEIIKEAILSRDTGNNSIYISEVRNEYNADSAQEIINNIISGDIEFQDMTRTAGLSGKQAYIRLSERLGSDKAASLLLSDHGIKGHKYWDGSSRNRAGDKTFNFVIYDDEVIEIVETFFQAQKGAPPKGAFSILENNRKVITLFEGADLSTILHETAHFAFNEYLELERNGTATESLKQDIETVRQWVGAEKGAELNRSQLEQFAKGFELWLFEGKAPNIELESAFARFQRWLVSVYKTAKNASERLGIKLNKDIRGVFDRMVTINNDVTTAVEGLSIKTDAELNALGVIDEDKRYMKRAIKDVMRKAERKLSKKLNKDYRQNLAKWKKEADSEIRAEQPIYDVIDKITRKISRDEVIEEYNAIKKAVEEGEAAKRIPVRDKDGYILKWTVSGGTFPEYFKGLGFTKKEVVNVLNKAIEGKQLTEKQEITLDTLIEGYRDEILRLAGSDASTISFPEDTRFDKIELIERYGKDALKNLPDKNLAIEFGMPIDETAITFGYDDGAAFINDLFNTKPLNEAISERANEKRARHDAQFKAEDYIVGTREYSDYVDILSKYLDKNLKGTPRERKLASRSAIKTAAKQAIRQKSVEEAQRVDKFLSAMKKAASEERRAILKKDWATAARANERMRFNQVMAAESVKVREQIRSILARAKRKAKSKNINFDHSEAIKHLISRFRLADIVPQEPTKQPDYKTLFAAEYDKDDPNAPATPNDGFAMPDFIETNMVDHYRHLSIDQLQELDNAIRYLAKQGIIDKDKYLSDGVTELEADAVLPMSETMLKVKPLTVWEKGSLMNRLSDVGRKIFASLESLNFTAFAIDGYSNIGSNGKKGLFERLVIDPIKRAETARTQRKRSLDALMKPHLVQIRKTMQKWGFSNTGNITIPGVEIPQILRENGQTTGWFGRQIFALALNANESNKERIKLGLGMTDQELRAVYDFLSKEDWDAVRGIWSAIDSLFDDVDKVHLKLKGYHVTRVAATPVNTKHGTFSAGYYPLKYDPELDFVVEDRKAYADEISRHDTNFVTPFAQSGFTQKRVNGVALPVMLRLGIIDDHIDEVLRYVYMSEVIRDADRVTRHERFRAAAVKAIGRPAYDSIRPALKYIINPKRSGMDLPLARSVEWIKGLGTAWVLAWNTGVAIKQPLSTFGAINDIGLKAYLNGFSSTLMSPMVHYQEMLKLSGYMADRRRNFDRELQRGFKGLDSKQRAFYFGDSSLTWDDVVDLGYWQIRAADTVTVLPIWWGAFNKKLKADQTNLQEAIEYADDSVRNSQPSAQSLDLSSWQRDGGVIRLFSMFQTFTVGKYGQRQRAFFRAWRNGTISTREYAYFNFMDAIVPLVAINLLQAIIWGRDLEDDDTQRDILVDIFSSWALMGVPFASNLKYAFESGDLMSSAPIKTLEQMWDGVRSITNLKDFDNKRKRDKALWGLANAISIFSRVPVSKVVKKAEKGAEAKEAMPLIKYVVPPPKKKR